MRISHPRLVIALAASALLPSTSSSQVVKEAQIRIAAVSYVLSFLRPYDAGPELACVSVSRVAPSGGRVGPIKAVADLDSATLAAIPRSRLPVRPGSACYIAQVPPMRRLEKGTDRQAVMIVVAAPEFESENRAAIVVQYSVHGRNGAGFICTVARRDGPWQIESCDRTWIS